MRLPFTKLPEINPKTWRAELLVLILRASLLLSILVYPPSMYMVFKSGYIGVAVADTLAVVILVCLYFFDRLPYRIRAAIFCLVCYMLGVALLISVGSISQIYLIGFSILTTLLLGLRTGLFSTALSSLTMLAIGALSLVAPEMDIANWTRDYSGWAVITLNFALISFVLTLGVGAVIAGIESALAREMAARATLDRERMLLRTLIDTLPDVVFTKDAQGRFVISNPATLDTFGLNREHELAGKTVRDLLPHEIAEALHAGDLQVLQGSPMLNQEIRTVAPDGTPRLFLTTKVPLRDRDSTIVGMVGISREITERKRMEAERDRLLEHLRLQIDRMPLAYLLTDAEIRYTRWNPAAEKMFGFTEAEVLGKLPFDVIVPTEAQPFVAHIFERLKQGDMNAHGECDNRTKAGGTITCEWFNTPLFNGDGAFAGLLSLAQNISERKKLEEQLRQAHKMEAVGQLAGGIAHDFNNLVTVISGYCELLLAKSELDADIRNSVQAISEAGEWAASLTRRLLAFSRQTILQPKVLNLNSVVIETGNMLRRLIGEDIEFKTILDPNISRVRVDPGQLDQILMNLAVNARHAMPRGGKLTIETKNVEISEGNTVAHPNRLTGQHVMLAMSDTGCGMTPEVMSRIFEPFFTTKGVGKGSGLGLAMVFGIVQQSGGCIQVSSEVGQGTTFKIYFPATEEQVSKKLAPAANPELRGVETILLAEDEEGVRGLAFRSLQLHGYQVLVAADGKEALRLVKEHSGTIDLLLTDVVMPNMSGPELAQSIRTIYPQIKILFMSGYTDDAVVRHGLLQAEVAFLQKPFTPTKLAQKIRQVLDEK